MALVELLMHGFATLPGKAKWEIDMWRWIMGYDIMDFLQGFILSPKP